MQSKRIKYLRVQGSRVCLSIQLPSPKAYENVLSIDSIEAEIEADVFHIIEKCY